MMNSNQQTFDASYLIDQRVRVHLLIPAGGNVTSLLSKGENDYRVRGYNDHGIFLTQGQTERILFFPWNGVALESVAEGIQQRKTG